MKDTSCSMQNYTVIKFAFGALQPYYNRSNRLYYYMMIYGYSGKAVSGILLGTLGYCVMHSSEASECLQVWWSIGIVGVSRGRRGWSSNSSWCVKVDGGSDEVGTVRRYSTCLRFRRTLGVTAYEEWPASSGAKGGQWCDPRSFNFKIQILIGFPKSSTWCQDASRISSLQWLGAVVTATDSCSHRVLTRMGGPPFSSVLRHELSSMNLFLIWACLPSWAPNWF